MAKASIPVTPKKRGRPATGQDPVLTVRVPPVTRLAIENWAKQQKDRPSRSEAIRRLIEIALAAKPKRYPERISCETVRAALEVSGMRRPRAKRTKPF